jgi:hypothetical protein
MSRTAERASDYASGIKDRLTDAASSNFQGGMDRMLREQPLAVAALGVAAGAAVAAVFPSTEVESRALAGARQALSEAAGKAGENLMEAAGAAGERLKTVVEEKGLNPEGLKDIAREVAGTFAGSIAGKTDEQPTFVPAAPAKQRGVGAASLAPGLTSSTGRDER